MRTIVDALQVWVMDMRPMALYHRIKDGCTACHIPLMGFGYRRDYRDVQLNCGRPCSGCFPREARRIASGEEA